MESRASVRAHVFDGNEAPPSPLEMRPNDPSNRPHGTIPNTSLMVSVIAFTLGIIFCFGSLLFFGVINLRWWTTNQLGFFIASWATFHLLEFVVTAGWNRDRLSVDSYLLDNGALYHVATSISVLEYLLELYIKPNYKTFPYITNIGVLLVIMSQTLRSAAMIHASSNFSHTVAVYKMETHRLVTDGVYSWFRHPSYTGYFYWGIGVQLVLQNPFSFVIYTIVLWRFFYRRIKVEEAYLTRFFGQQYIDYRRRVGTRIPFIP